MCGDVHCRDSLYQTCNLFAFLTENVCDNALDLENERLNIEGNLPKGSYCQWLILAQDDDSYVTLEFQKFNVRNIGPNLLLDVQQKFSTSGSVAEKQLTTRRLLERVNIYQMSSSRKIALPDVQQNFYRMSSRTFTRRLVDQMIWAIIALNE